MNEENAIITAVTVTDWCRKKPEKDTGDVNGDLGAALMDLVYKPLVFPFLEEELILLERRIIVSLRRPDYKEVAWEYDPPGIFIIPSIPHCYNRLKYYLPIKVRFYEEYGRLYMKAGYGQPYKYLDS